MINYIKKLIKYYKHFGLTLKVDRVAVIGTPSGTLKVIKHPNNKITEEQIIRNTLFTQGDNKWK